MGVLPPRKKNANLFQRVEFANFDEEFLSLGVFFAL